MRRRSLLALAIVIPLASLVVWHSHGSGGGGKPSEKIEQAVFLLVVDTLRADRLSCYGYLKHLTPNIDALAARGTRFVNAQAPGSWTNPSMGAMLTSLYPGQLGIVEKPTVDEAAFGERQRRVPTRWDLPRFARTAAEVFRDGGYTTAAFVNQPGLNWSESWRRGFAKYYLPLGPTEIVEVSELESAVEPEASWGQVPMVTAASVTDRSLVKRFGEWLTMNRDEKRLFAWVHLLTTHWPYNPPDADPSAQCELQHQSASWSGSDCYDSEIQIVDAMIGELVSLIRAQVREDHYSIVFVSDHGDEFLERGSRDHGHSLHREVAQVPLIIVGAAVPRKQTVERYVSTIDVLPTLAHLGSVEKLLPKEIEGSSLVPLGKGKPIFAQGMLYGPSESMLIADQRKLLVDRARTAPQLYDLAKDPEERHDVSAQNQELVAALSSQLAAQQARLLADYRRRETEPPEPAAPHNQGDSTEALEALGYIER